MQVKLIIYEQIEHEVEEGAAHAARIAKEANMGKGKEVTVLENPTPEEKELANLQKATKESLAQKQNIPHGIGQSSGAEELDDDFDDDQHK